jgi:acetyl esterase/lipase
MHAPTESESGQELEPTTHTLWPNGVPGAPLTEVPPRIVTDRPEGGDRHVRNVHAPTLTVYRPEESSTGKQPAVIVCPGGGYGVLALDKEGHDIASWLASSGVVGVVLEYRLPRPEGHVYGHAAPLADAAQALSLVRENAEAWGVDPARVGIMGFSAGGHLAASASVQLTENGPNFTVLVYPVVSFLPGIGHGGSRRNLLGSDEDQDLIERYSSELQVTPETPPAFLVHTSDDPVRVENSLRYYEALRAKKVPAALHVFARGGHGYAMRRPELPVGRWPDLLLEWMRGSGWLER